MPLSKGSGSGCYQTGNWTRWTLALISSGNSDAGKLKKKKKSGGTGFFCLSLVVFIHSSTEMAMTAASTERKGKAGPGH